MRLPHHTCLALSHDEQSKLSAKAVNLELSDLATKIKSLDIARIASNIRGVLVEPLGTIDIASLPRGGMNIHIPIEFKDGKKWYARIRQQRFDSPPLEISRLIMVSEVMTMKVLKEGGVLVPECYIPKESSELINYFFLDHIDGSSSSAPISRLLTPEQSKNLITSYAEISIGISNLSFDGIGSLFPNDSPEIGRSISKVGPLVNLNLCSSTPSYFLGPFKTSRDRYLAMIDHTLESIRDSIGGYFGEVMGMVYTHLWLRDVIMGIEELGKIVPTYIKHADDKGDQLMIDDNYKITGIIDWENAYTAPLAEAFASPLAFVSVRDFCSGDNTLSAYEIQLAETYDILGRSDLGDCIRGGKIYQRLDMIIGQPPDLGQLHGLQEIVSGVKGDERNFEEWVEGLRVKYGDIGINGISQ